MMGDRSRVFVLGPRVRHTMAPGPNAVETPASFPTMSGILSLWRARKPN